MLWALGTDLVGELFGEGLIISGGNVIDNDGFDASVRLVFDRLRTGAEGGGAVLGGNDDRN